jgi:hypothetical protein
MPDPYPEAAALAAHFRLHVRGDVEPTSIKHVATRRGVEPAPWLADLLACAPETAGVAPPAPRLLAGLHDVAANHCLPKRPVCDGCPLAYDCPSREKTPRRRPSLVLRLCGMVGAPDVAERCDVDVVLVKAWAAGTASPSDAETERMLLLMAYLKQVKQERSAERPVVLWAS